MPLTPEEQSMLDYLIEVSRTPTPSTDSVISFDSTAIVRLFTRLVTLRDFATQQLQINAQCNQRIVNLEFKLRNPTVDGGEVYLSLTPAGDDRPEQQ